MKPGVAAASYAGKPMVLLYPHGRGESVSLTPEEAKDLAKSLSDAISQCLRAHGIPVESIGESTGRTVL